MLDEPYSLNAAEKRHLAELLDELLPPKKPQHVSAAEARALTAIIGELDRVAGTTSGTGGRGPGPGDEKVSAVAEIAPEVSGSRIAETPSAPKNNAGSLGATLGRCNWTNAKPIVTTTTAPTTLRDILARTNWTNGKASA